MKVCFDCETTTRNKGNPFTKGNWLCSFSHRTERSSAVFDYYTQPDFITNLRRIFKDATFLIGHNIKFDLHWAARFGIVSEKGTRIWDTQLAEFILSGQTNSFASLNSLAEKYNLGTKEDEVAKYWDQGIDTPDIPVEILKSYGNMDVELTWKVYECQLKDPRITPRLHKLILLDGADLLVLSKMERNGLKYDSDRSIEEGNKLRVELDEIESSLNSMVNCPGFNWDSGDHLSSFLYGGFIKLDRFEPTELIYKSGPKKGRSYIQNKYVRTDEYKFPGLFKSVRGSEVAKSTKERPLFSTAEPILKQLRGGSKSSRDAIRSLLRRSGLAKLIETYFIKLPQMIEEMEWGDGYIHGQYNQVVARTGRLSSSKPNMQNNPKEVDRMFVSRYN